MPLPSLCLLPLAVSAPARAEGLVSEIKLGALYHDPAHLWSSFSREQPAVDFNAELLFHPIGSFLGGEIRPAIGGTLNPNGETSKAYVDLRWQHAIGTGMYVALGLGAAVHNGELDPLPGRKGLGTRVLFHPSLEIGVNLDGSNNVSLFFDHVSNGNATAVNEGHDTVGLRFGHRF